MSYDYVHEPITVTAAFPPRGRVKITSFEWQGKTYTVDKVNLSTRANKGEARVWLFSVSTKTAAFKLRLDTDTLQWWMEEFTWDDAKAQ
jgi:galactose mutarotase-like enzyme